MPIEIKGETYVTASEAAEYLGVSRPTFYSNVQPHITEFKHGALRRSYYRLVEVLQYQGLRPADEDEKKQ